MTQKAHIIVGLGYGDESKGSMIDYLCRSNGHDLVIRFNGGSQAAHSVVLPNGTYHTFAQIGSGAFTGAKTLLSQYMYVDPIALADEVALLSPKLGFYALNTHFIHENCPVITPFHVAANRIREYLRGDKKHGSTGKGVSEVAMDVHHNPIMVLHMKNFLQPPGHQMYGLRVIRDTKRAECIPVSVVFDMELPIEISEALGILTMSDENVGALAYAYYAIIQELNLVSDKRARQMIRNSSPLFEGAQGVLLDEKHGFAPHNTWSNCTPENALQLLKQAQFDGDIEITGVTRTYHTRHGAGPFPTENIESPGYDHHEHNVTNPWQDHFRTGCLDLTLLRYALSCVPSVQNIALTHCDVFHTNQLVSICQEYTESITPLSLRYYKNCTQMLYESKPVHVGTYTQEEMLDVFKHRKFPTIQYLSSGPTWKDKQNRGDIW